MTSRPAYSPWEPALGWSETAAKPVHLASQVSRSRKSLAVAAGLLGGANGCSLPNSGHETGNISLVALSFIVHEPSEIIEWQSERSFASSRLM
jgi:hypothetical protein